MALVQNQKDSSDAPASRDYQTRQGTRTPSDAQKVIFNDEKLGDLTGSAMDESFGGMGLLLQKPPTLKVGQNLEYTQNGLVGSAIVRHITRGPKGYLVGLEWRGANLAQLAREASQERAKNPPVGFTITREREQFLQTLSSSVHMIWSLCEAQNWDELTQYVSRLLERAKSQGIVRLDEPVQALRRRFQNGDTSDAFMRDIVIVVKTCIAICRDGE